MKIETVKACDVTTGDIIEKNGARWRVLRAITTAIGPFEGREFLCVPITTIPGLDSVYWNQFSDDSLTVWKASIVK